MPPFEPGIQTTLLQFLPQNITYLVLLKSLEKQLAQAPPLSLQSKPSPTLDSSGKDGDCLQCDLYLAPSTIPGAGLGIFSGVPKEIGDTVGNGDICIPFLDLHWHNDGWRKDQDFFFPMKDYVWDGLVMGMQMEVEDDDIEAWWPGLDCAINCHEALLNVEKAVPAYDEGGLHRGKHPGAGAISPYHNGTTSVSRMIPQGGELFKYYGDDWFTTRQPTFGNIPLYKHHKAALKVLKKLALMKTKLRPGIFKVMIGIRDIWDFRIMNALPDSWNEAKVALRGEDMGLLYQPHATRSIQWLNENGKCIDHIVPKQSTIGGAGHGAFAKRDLPKGTIITGSPLLHVPHYKIFHIYDYDEEDLFYTDEEKPKPRRLDTIIGEQVALNYCFGNANSTLLVCPYGSGVNYINHNRSLANVKIQWAKDGSTGHNAHWFNMTPNDMNFIYQANLALDYVATKDIAEDEEIFLDYGDDWEKAWQQHVANWEPLDHWKDYVSGTQFNKIYATDPVRTQMEQIENPYLENLDIRCHQFILEDEHADRPTMEYDPELEWDLPFDKGWPCEILERDDEEQTYTVRVRHKAFGTPRIDVVEEVSRQAIVFLDLPYSTDIHLVRAFRHPLGIPDNMMPEAWKNIMPENGNDEL